MKYIKHIDESQSLNEEASKTVALTTERENQAKLNDRIVKLKKDMAKIDVTNKKPAEKDAAKARLIQQVGNLTVQIGQSMAKESALMISIAKTE